MPQLSRLFHDFLLDFSKVSRFYPAAPSDRKWSAARLNYPAARRTRVAQVLERQNRAWGASPQTLANLQRLRDGASAIVTGQQLGLFGGPLFSIFKALTAIKVAAESSAGGAPAVPIFWLATEDHDLDEVRFTYLLDREGRLKRVEIAPQAKAGAPVGGVVLGDEITAAVQSATEALGPGPMADALRESYRPGTTMADAFAKLFARLFGEFGLIFIDNSDPELHAIAQPIYLAAAQQAPELHAALLARSKDLESAGYHAQVHLSATSTLLFHVQDGVRTAVHREGSAFRAGHERWAADAFAHQIKTRPENFNGNALLRPVVQDFLLPTLAYVGGPAEIAYFAQSEVVYSKLLGRATPILPRASATLVDPASRRHIEKYGLKFEDAFARSEDLRQRLATSTLSAELKKQLDAAQSGLDGLVGPLEHDLGAWEPTLAASAAKAKAKMKHQLDRLARRAAAAEARRNSDIDRHAQHLADSLFPHGNLQEREIAGVTFLARYGGGLLRELADAIQPACPGHQLLFP